MKFRINLWGKNGVKSFLSLSLLQALPVLLSFTLSAGNRNKRCRRKPRVDRDNISHGGCWGDDNDDGLEATTAKNGVFRSNNLASETRLRTSSVDERLAWKNRRHLSRLLSSITTDPWKPLITLFYSLFSRRSSERFHRWKGKSVRSKHRDSKMWVYR